MGEGGGAYSSRGGRLIEGKRLIEWGGSLFIFSQIVARHYHFFLIHHLRVNNNIICLSTQKVDHKV